MSTSSRTATARSVTSSQLPGLVRCDVHRDCNRSNLRHRDHLHRRQRSSEDRWAFWDHSGNRRLGPLQLHELRPRDRSGGVLRFWLHHRGDRRQWHRHPGRSDRHPVLEVDCRNAIRLRILELEQWEFRLDYIESHLSHWGRKHSEHSGELRRQHGADCHDPELQPSLTPDQRLRPGLDHDQRCRRGQHLGRLDVEDHARREHLPSLDRLERPRGCGDPLGLARPVPVLRHLSLHRREPPGQHQPVQGRHPDRGGHPERRHGQRHPADQLGRDRQHGADCHSPISHYRRRRCQDDHAHWLRQRRRLACLRSDDASRQRLALRGHRDPPVTRSSPPNCRTPCRAPS